MTSPIDDMCNRLITAYREEMRGRDLAMFDLAVALEMKRRGLADRDFAQLLRIRAEEHRRQTPLIWSLMRELANHFGGPNVVSLPQPGAKP